MHYLWFEDCVVSVLLFNLWQEIDQEWWKKIQCPISEFKSSKPLRKDTFAEQEKKRKCLGYLKLKPIKELDKSKLPSNRQVLKHFFLL